MEENILEVTDLRAGYGESEVLHGISLRVHEGEFLAIAGPNGAGKSTLLHVLAGLKSPIEGSVALDGRRLADYGRRRLAQRIAVIFQDFSCSYDFSVFDMVAMGRSPYLTRWQPLSTRDRAIIHDAMEMTEVSNLRHRLFCELSGGERQRVIIAKALAQQPSLLLLDEPSTHLDLHHQVNTFNILRRLNRQSRVTILCIIHDLTLAAQFADRFLLLCAGECLAEGTPQEVLQQELIEDLFAVPVTVGIIGKTNTPYVYAMGE